MSFFPFNASHPLPYGVFISFFWTYQIRYISTPPFWTKLLYCLVVATAFLWTVTSIVAQQQVAG